MQQLPKDGGVRGIYIPDAGHWFISADYKQLEVTLAAHFSRDKNLLSIVYDGASQHDITAKGLGVSRGIAKTINFALQYGAGAKKIQSILGCSEADAESALTKYWETYSGLRDFIKECHGRVEQGRPLINPFGRRRRFPDPKNLNHWELERCKRQAANAVIQGTGADLTNRAFYLVNDALQAMGAGKAIFVIHDEIMLSVPEGGLDKAAQVLQDKMILVGQEINLSVPLSVDVSKPMLRWEKG
jgi:DNA polymerase-1